MAFGLVMFATFVAQGAEPHPEGGSALAADPPGRLRGGFDLGVTVGMATAANGCNGNGGNDCFLLTPMFVGELGYQADSAFRGEVACRAGARRRVQLRRRLPHAGGNADARVLAGGRKAA